jgi:hypothetical protein
MSDITIPQQILAVSNVKVLAADPPISGGVAVVITMDVETGGTITLALGVLDTAALVRGLEATKGRKPVVGV